MALAPLTEFNNQTAFDSRTMTKEPTMSNAKSPEGADSKGEAMPSTEETTATPPHGDALLDPAGDTRETPPTPDDIVEGVLATAPVA